MSGPVALPAGCAENANQAPSGENAADSPTTTTLVAIERIARAVGAGVPGGSESAGDVLGPAGVLDAAVVDSGVALAGGTEAAGVGEEPIGLPDGPPGGVDVGAAVGPLDGGGETLPPPTETTNSVVAVDPGALPTTMTRPRSGDDTMLFGVTFSLPSDDAWASIGAQLEVEPGGQTWSTFAS